MCATVNVFRCELQDLQYGTSCMSNRGSLSSKSFCDATQCTASKRDFVAQVAQGTGQLSKILNRSSKLGTTL